MKLSKNFSSSEFCRSASLPGYRVEPTYYQLKQMEALCKLILQPLRDRVAGLCKLKGKQKIIRINSGIRDQAIFKALKTKGYKPSATSDHFYHSIINPTGSGAADLSWPYAKFKEADYGRIYKFVERQYSHYSNQIIWYRSKDFIHISLSKKISFKFVRNSHKRSFIKE